MFRGMRRARQALTSAEIDEILKKATSGVLALNGDGGYPYAVPLSYVYSDGKIYFHCAKEGYKIDAVKSCNKASFCVIAQDDVLAEKYTTCYKSVIAFGKIKLLEGDCIKEPVRALAERYSCPGGSEMQDEIDKYKNKMYIMAFEIEHLTGKQCVEFIK